MISVRELLVILSASMMAVYPAMGADTGFYAGVGVGQSTVEIDDSDIDFDETDVGWKAFAGYRFMPYFGVEGGYVNLGEPDDTLTVEDIDVDLEVELDGWNLYAVGFWPIGEKWDLFGKFGVIAWDADLKASAAGLSASEGDDGEDLAYGLGFGWNFSERFSLRGEWEYFDIDDADEVYLLSVGVVYRF